MCPDEISRSDAMASKANPQPIAATVLAKKTSDAQPHHDLAQQYGGQHAGAWVDRLPAAVIPYIQLTRLSPPAGLLLIFLPHLFGILHAAIVLSAPETTATSTTASMLTGSTTTTSGVGHAAPLPLSQILRA